MPYQCSTLEPIPFAHGHNTHFLDDPELVCFLDSEFNYDHKPPAIKVEPLYAFPLAMQRSTSNSSSSSTSTVDTDDDLSTPSHSRRKICAMDGCLRNVRSKGYCKSHGGGKQCSMDGCAKEAQNGQFCIGHGGGKCCKVPNCSNAAQSQGLCKAHGGGARCKFKDCEKSSQGGGFCRTHGGGKRCVEPGCTKGAQRGNKCAKHGGCRTQALHRVGLLRKSMGMCTPHVREWRAVRGCGDVMLGLKTEALSLSIH
ncbi:hypothetical protein SPRG_03520 [Saprolegnia parasitica CBS 223.65]|uniref:WRKY19-like zinc finger domain-containing protein n=1 Tax=Saprolegnia parasitica (strain CBS 223.65) TaxID=695850 RepID=A0A067CYJ0_SAPPC|nr:hypothetical protein SPRG_03520 [Saprolegnia parasitica CBS 223.65]KDO31591.1 hypothetical protein SPRG_03520 [Saprolegnia parasitica CBS 223.65]|eukprot:XP_012197491.1 hypothetical protein SPRG_03520 [Saprolegnia parasitica CBS 223.65]